MYIIVTLTMTYPGFAPIIVTVNLNLIGETISNLMVITDQLSGWSTYVGRSFDSIAKQKKLHIFTSN